jgi:hypothetical protein
MWQDFVRDRLPLDHARPHPVSAFPGLPTRDVNELGRTFPGSLSFPAPEPNLPPSPRRLARARHSQ